MASGPICARTNPAALGATLVDHHVVRCLCGQTVSGAALWHRTADRRYRAGHHGAAFISSVMREVFRMAPDRSKRQPTGWAHPMECGVGCRDALVAGRRHWRHHARTRPGTGRDDAVTFVIGNAHRISTSLLAPATTIPPRLRMNLPRRSVTLYLGPVCARLAAVCPDLHRDCQRAVVAHATGTCGVRRT